MAESLKSKSREDFKSLERHEIDHSQATYNPEDKDAEFGGPAERAKLEKKMLRKVDARMLILVVIYM